MRKCRNLLVTVCFLLIPFSLLAQHNNETTKTKFRFGSYNSIVMYQGFRSFTAGFQSVDGFESKGFYGGAGVGVDFYGLRTIPVFFDLRKMIALGRQSFFVYGDIGFHIPWIPEDHGNRSWSSAYKSRGGLYYDIGAGYMKKFNKNHALVFSGGFTFKEMNEQYGFSPCSWPGRDCELVYESYNYRFNRWAFKVGWRF